MSELKTASLLHAAPASPEAILAELQAYKSQDLPWASGKVFAYVYEPAPEAKALISQAYSLFLTENGLDPTSFPSLLRLENELIRSAADMLGGDEQTVGSFTSGGTESIMLAVKMARDYFRAHKPEITQPEMIIAHTAHAAFQKAAHYLGLKPVILTVTAPDYRLEAAQVEAAITPNTVLIVGSAPNYPFGVVDAIADLAALAKSKGIFMHVDACVGGMYLPFLPEGSVEPFDFSVEGVTSMSCDFHKYGYAAKGASCVLYRHAGLRQYQIFTCSDWAGYTIVNPTVLSSKTGGPLAGAWAAMRYFGREGYTEMVRQTQAGTQAFIEGVGAIPELQVLGEPVMNLVAVISREPKLSVFDIADRMKAKGWYLQVQLASPQAPEALHLNINRANCPHIPAVLAELKATVAELLANPPQSPLAEMFSPEMIEMFMANFSPDMLDSLEQMLGMGGEGGNAVPQDMAMINNILNGLSPQHRDTLLRAFVNRMFK